MAYFYRFGLAVLVFLSVSSGLTKAMLMPDDVAFFGRYGFTNPVLIAFGVIQVVAGVMIIFPKTRFYGALVVFITFLVSAIMLVLNQNTMFMIFTILAMVLLGIVMRKSRMKS